MGLNDQDIKYISKKLLLAPQIVEKLSEEDSDANLLINETSVKNIKNTDVSKLTLLTYIKLVVCRYSYETEFSINDKVYISKCIYYHFPEIKRCLDYKLITSKGGPTERKSQYFLVLAGFFHNKVSPDFFYNGYKKFISDGFRCREELRDISQHIWEWVEILQDIEKRGWFDPQPKNRGLLLKS